MSENLDILKQGYENFNRGEILAARALVTADAEWGTSGRFPGIEGVYRGPDAIEQWMKAIRSAWEWFEVSIEEVVHDSREMVVVVERLRGRGRTSGVDVEMRNYAVYRFSEGKLVKREAFGERDAAVRAAGL